MKTAMIIVGTTNFDRLIETLDTEELYNVFKSNGFTKIIFQIGRLFSNKTKKLFIRNDKYISI